MLRRMANWVLPRMIRWFDDSIPAETMTRYIAAQLSRVLAVPSWQNPRDQALVERLRNHSPDALLSLPLADTATADGATLDLARAWLRALPAGRVLTRGVLVSNCGESLLRLTRAELTSAEQAQVAEELERLLRHVETARRRSLQQFSPPLDRESAWLERHAITGLFLEVAQRNRDWRFLNAALKLNDSALAAHRRLSPESPRLLRYLSNLVKQKALLKRMVD